MIGSPPTANTGSVSGGGITIGQIEYYASTDGVMTETSRLSGLNESLPVVRSQVVLTVPGEGNSGGAVPKRTAPLMSASWALAADALALDKGFIEAITDYTNTETSDALTGQEQQTEATLATVMSDIAENKFAPGLTAQALEVQVSALQNSLASLVVQQPGSGLQSSRLPLPRPLPQWSPAPPPSWTTKPCWAAVGLVIGLLARRPRRRWSLDAGSSPEDRQAGRAGLGLSGRRRDSVRDERLDRGLPQALGDGLPGAAPSAARRQRTNGSTTERTRARARVGSRGGQAGRL